MKCPNCGLLNPPSALRCDCGYNFASQTIDQSYAVAGEKYQKSKFFIQWAVFSLIGTLIFFAFRFGLIRFNLRPPLAVIVALMPAYFALGAIVMDIPPSRAANVLEGVAIIGDAMYYGLVLLIIWRGLMALLRRTSWWSKPGRSTLFRQRSRG